MQIAMAQALSVQLLFDLFDHSEAELVLRAPGQNQQTRELIRARKTSHTWTWQQQKPESATVTLTRHAQKYWFKKGFVYSDVKKR